MNNRDVTRHDRLVALSGSFRPCRPPFPWTGPPRVVERSRTPVLMLMLRKPRHVLMLRVNVQFLLVFAFVFFYIIVVRYLFCLYFSKKLEIRLVSFC